VTGTGSAARGKGREMERGKGKEMERARGKEMERARGRGTGTGKERGRERARGMDWGVAQGQGWAASGPRLLLLERRRLRPLRSGRTSGGSIRPAPSMLGCTCPTPAARHGKSGLSNSTSFKSLAPVEATQAGGMSQRRL
jgi:hypothetical protein